ncbi:MAG: hypothetical protein HY243_13850 [Proteobacteria bacterium]|nr:hypothetical protein [Pseudomonadota bacterium]
MPIKIINLLLISGIALLSFRDWLKYRRLKFEDPFDAKINSQLKKLGYVTLALLGLSITTMFVTLLAIGRIIVSSAKLGIHV